jgi:hypothetical protein
MSERECSILQNRVAELKGFMPLCMEIQSGKQALLSLHVPYGPGHNDSVLPQEEEGELLGATGNCAILIFSGRNTLLEFPCTCIVAVSSFSQWYFESFLQISLAIFFRCLCYFQSGLRQASHIWTSSVIGLWSVILQTTRRNSVSRGECIVETKQSRYR